MTPRTPAVLPAAVLLALSALLLLLAAPPAHGRELQQSCACTRSPVCSPGMACPQYIICETDPSKCDPPPQQCVCNKACIQGTTCQCINGQAQCVGTQPQPQPQCVCNKLCIKGTTCKCINGQAQCVGASQPQPGCCCGPPVVSASYSARPCLNPCNNCPIGRR